MKRPRRRVSLLHLRPLKHNEYRSKLYGLLALREIFGRVNVNLLDFRVCDKASGFSINSFKDPQHGRLIVRTDPERLNHTQSLKEWVSMPRLNLYLKNQPPERTEKMVKQWMKAAKKKKPEARFIVHKVRGLGEYDHFVQLNVDFNTGKVVISKTGAGTDKFRDEKGTLTTLTIDDRWKIRRAIGSKVILPEGLQTNTINALRRISNFAAETGHRVFEASYVTYKDAPSEPEFYDLIFGKKM